MHPGRNDPCPCNSGKKYKHCCLAAASAQALAPELLVWRRVRRTLEGFVDRMFEFVVRTYGDDAVDEAWDEFTLWDEAYGAFDDASPYIPLFVPWMFHRWAPDPMETSVVDAELHDCTPTRAYLARKGRNLDPMLRAYLEGCLRAPLSFHEVLHCDPGKSLQLRDVFSGGECTVLESSASRSVHVGDVLYAQIVEVQGICLLEACSPVLLPPQRKLELIQLRRELQGEGGSESLNIDGKDREDILREHYLRMADELLNPSAPVLQNTDGEPLAMQQLVFDIDSPELAFERLKHLEVTASESELRAQAEFDASGALQRVQFTWGRLGNAVHESWNNTILGGIEIDGARLSLHVNSERRAAEGRQLIEQALGDAARYRLSSHESFDPAMATGTAIQSEPSTRHARDPAMEREMQKQLAAFMAQHVDSWPEESLPALDGRTPLEAVRDADGREMVEALLRQFERQPHYTQDPELLPRLRARLGLT